MMTDEQQTWFDLFVLFLVVIAVYYLKIRTGDGPNPFDAVQAFLGVKG